MLLPVIAKFQYSGSELMLRCKYKAPQQKALGSKENTC